MKIFVTGGAGYIGSHTVLELIKSGHEVAVFDNLVKGHREVIEILNNKLNTNIKFFHGDLVNLEDIEKALGEFLPEAVIHFAAFSEVGESVNDPNKYYKNNNYGGVNLLNAMRSRGVNKIVFSSTAAVFGQPDEIPIKETTEKNPINPYGRSKLFFEKILEDNEKAYGIKYVVLRYFNACGAELEGMIGEDHDPESHLIPIIMEAAKGERDKVSIYGTDYDTKDGTCVRDYIHVIDLADAHIKAVEYLAKDNVSDNFNLGSSSGFTVKEVIEKVKEVTGKNFQVAIGDRRAGDPAVLIADNTKAKKILKWETKYGLNEIISSAWKWETNKGKYEY